MVLFDVNQCMKIDVYWNYPAFCIYFSPGVVEEITELLLVLQHSRSEHSPRKDAPPERGVVPIEQQIGAAMKARSPV